MDGWLPYFGPKVRLNIMVAEVRGREGCLSHGDQERQSKKERKKR
jgi:hypothetical protein